MGNCGACTVLVAAVREAVPLRHNAYKIPLLRALVRRALQTLAQRP